MVYILDYSWRFRKFHGVIINPNNRSKGTFNLSQLLQLNEGLVLLVIAAVLLIRSCLMYCAAMLEGRLYASQPHRHDCDRNTHYSTKNLPNIMKNKEHGHRVVNEISAAVAR